MNVQLWKVVIVYICIIRIKVTYGLINAWCLSHLILVFAEAAGFMDLPKEMILEVLSYISLPRLMAAMAVISQKCYRLVHMSVLWRRLSLCNVDCITYTKLVLTQIFLSPWNRLPLCLFWWKLILMSPQIWCRCCSRILYEFSKLGHWHKWFHHRFILLIVYAQTETFCCGFLYGNQLGPICVHSSLFGLRTAKYVLVLSVDVSCN